MRADSVGLFWQDAEPERGKDRIARVMPEIPRTNWTKLRDLPNLERAKVIGVDTETHDPDIENNGPGWARGLGNVAGISICADGEAQWYFPIAHTIEPQDNYETERILGWLKHELSRTNQHKVGANLIYDVGWLRQEGVRIKGPMWDIQYAEALLNENAFVALETLGQKYVGTGKETSLLYQWLADYYGGEPTGTQRKNIFRSPPRLAAPYAEQDAALPIQILNKQWPLLVQHNLLHLFELECGLIPLLVDMRFAGVKVDIPKAEQVRDRLVVREAEAAKELTALVSFDVDINSAESIARAFRHLSLAYPMTKHKKPKPSFNKDFLKTVKHPIGAAIRKVKNIQKTRSTFVESYILESHVNGRIYPEFHPLKGDENGAKTGRFSSTYHNSPAKDEEMGQLVRGIYVPDDGHKQWRKFDYSQLQYRFLAHYAVGGGADELRQKFIDDPEADYHLLVQGLVEAVTGMHIERRPIKNVNFGYIFGMGIDHVAELLGLTRAAAKELTDKYHQGVPYVKATLKAASHEAQQTGIVKTILGRTLHFDMYEPAQWEDKRPALPYWEALKEYGSIRRAHTHKALNYKLQGSEGDIMKTGMLTCYRQGLFDVIGYPRLTVHDELDFSDPGGVDSAYEEARHIMANAIRCSVPIYVDCAVGANWGECL